jgi:sigma-B regulation protein RsbU (phosphoserine phosphatase)
VIEVQLLEKSLLDTLESPGDSLGLSKKELVKLYWQFKGREKEYRRDRDFWEATNDNLKDAYVRLDKKEQELKKAYEQISSDLEVASKMQTTLLPDVKNITSNELQIAVYHKQLNRVGGDYYDLFENKHNSYNLGLFDICGHGLSAALLMIFLKSQFMQISKKYSSPAKIVNEVNKASIKLLKDLKKYATVNYISFQKNKIKYVCGGGYGFVVTQTEDYVFDKTYNFLGLKDKLFEEYELPFNSGDLMALYTDGIVEAKNNAGQTYSRNRLNSIIQKNSIMDVQSLMGLCIEDYESFKIKDADDITLILIKKI